MPFVLLPILRLSPGVDAPPFATMTLRVFPAMILSQFAPRLTAVPLAVDSPDDLDCEFGVLDRAAAVVLLEAGNDFLSMIPYGFVNGIES